MSKKNSLTEAQRDELRHTPTEQTVKVLGFGARQRDGRIMNALVRRGLVREVRHKNKTLRGYVLTDAGEDLVKTIQNERSVAGSAFDESRLPDSCSLIGEHRAGAGTVRFYHSRRGVFIVRLYDASKGQRSGWEIYVPVSDGICATDTYDALDEWVGGVA